MNFSSLIRTFNRLSIPKKVAAGAAAIAGGVALVSIPLLSMQPPSPPSTFNEEAYYKNRIGGQSSGGNSTSTPKSTALDATTPNLPPLSGSDIDIPGLSSSSSDTTLNNKTNKSSITLDGTTGESSIKLDATDTPTENIEQNPSSKAPTENATGINGRPVNPYAGTSGLSRFTSPPSISNSPYKATPGSTTLRTPYSQPNSIGNSSAQPNSLQPSAGNTYSDLNPFDRNTPGGNTDANAIAPGTPGALPDQSSTAAGNLDRPSSNVATPTTPNNPSGDFNPAANPSNNGAASNFGG